MTTMPLHTAQHQHRHLLEGAAREVLADLLNVAYMVVDCEGMIVMARGAGTPFTPHPMKSVRPGIHISEAFASIPEHIDRYLNILNPDGKKTSRNAGEYPTYDFHGISHLYKVRLLPLFGPDDEIIGAMSIAADSDSGKTQMQAKHQLNNLLSNSPDGIFSINKNFEIQSYNPVVEMVNTPGPILGQICHKRFFDFDEPCPYCPVAETYRTGQPCASRCYHSRLNMHFSLSATPLYDLQTGEMVGAFETFRDVTELQAYEQAAIAHERGKLMLDTIPLCCALFDEQLNMVDCNLEALKFMQLRDKEDARARALTLFPEFQPDGRPSIEVMRQDMHQTMAGDRRRTEWQFLLPNGEAVPAEITLVSVNRGEEKLLAMYMRDMREEREMQAKVADTNERMRIMFDATPLGCTLTDRDFKSIECNDETLRMYGLKDIKEYQDNFFDLSPEFQPCGRRSAEMAAEHLNRAFEDGYDRFEWWHKKLNGEPLPVEITIVRVIEKDKPRVAGYIRDLRELKKVEAALERERAELVVAKEAAEDALRTKSSFLATMSHEIRTPMNAILGLSHMALGNEMPDAQREMFKRIHSAASGLLSVINDILDFSKIEARKLALEVAPFSLREQILGVLDILRFKSGNSNIQLTGHIDHIFSQPAFDALLGDAPRLRQVLINLVGNAMKFTTQGGVILEAEVVGHDSNGVDILFSVHDTGIGIEEKAIHDIFQPFTQADTSISRRFGGTGLGLVISKELVELMQGELKLESTPGFGSTFSFCVPLRFANAQEAKAVAEAATNDFSALRDRKVLLVEDNEINLFIAINLLEQVGISITTAENGEEALEFLRTQSFDLVLMDIQMPVLGGHEATRILRTMPEVQPNLPVIAMTAHAMSEDHAKSRDAGMNDHITKPIDPDVLYKTLLRWLSS